MVANRTIIGTITMLQGVSDKEALSWFEEWTFNQTKGMGVSTIIEAIFFREKDIEDTFKFLTENEWIQTGWNELISPQGQYVQILYDEESGQSLNNLKDVD
tara:strand:- start:658 stop:960 length:303 start_codon:yes stop_codon:yes gene_type:complete